jgi:hypothetical protein
MIARLKRLADFISLPIVIVSCVLGLIFCFYISNELIVPKHINEIIERSNNKQELIKVIKSFQSEEDSLKLRATFFLISSMEAKYHFSIDSQVVFKKLFLATDSISKVKNFVLIQNSQSSINIADRHRIFQQIKSNRRSVWDSLKKVYISKSERALIKVRDISVINSDLLIENIELAFEAWKFPWAKSLNFEQFCEYILPYKIDNEKPEVWRRVVMSRYKSIKDGLEDPLDTREVCKAINKQLQENFYINGTSLTYPIPLSFSELEILKMGKCTDANRYAACIMRALGIPVIIDSTPHWGNRNKGHNWLNLYYKNQFFSFIGCESQPGLDKISFAGYEYIERKMPKVYREYYSVQKNNLSFKYKTLNLPEYLKLNNIADVTDNYIPTFNPVVDVDESETYGNQIAFLAVFNNLQWKPVAWGEIHGGAVCFKKMGSNIVYLPAIYEDGIIIPIAAPFYINDEGMVIKIKVLEKKRSTKICLSKYPFEIRDGNANKIISGKTYELFYWNNRWMSLGKKTAIKDSLKFDNIPNDALLWLRSRGSGAQERIFTYDHLKQKFW